MTETAPTPMDEYIDAAMAALGSEDSEFYLSVRGGQPVELSCRYQDCIWGIYVGEMELWEFVADARQHWENKHATPDTTGEASDVREELAPPESEWFADVPGCDFSDCQHGCNGWPCGSERCTFVCHEGLPVRTAFEGSYLSA